MLKFHTPAETSAAAHAAIAASKAREIASRPPLVERVAEAMRDIIAIQGSGGVEDLALRFPDEDVTEEIVLKARRRAGQLAKVA